MAGPMKEQKLGDGNNAGKWRCLRGRKAHIRTQPRPIRPIRPIAARPPVDTAEPGNASSVLASGRFRLCLLATQ